MKIDKTKYTKELAFGMLPLFIFSLLASSIVLAQTGIDASVSVKPIPGIQCKPDVLTINSKVEWIYCFLSFENAPSSDIDLSTVYLSVDGKPGSILADQSYFHLGDFLNVGGEQAIVRFSRADADSNWFLEPPIPPSRTFTLTVSGNLKTSGFAFSGKDTILVKKTAEKTFVAYTPFNISKSGTILKFEGLDLDKYVPRYNNFNGHFNMGGDPTISGINGFYSSGTISTPYTFNFLGIDITLFKKVTYQLAALFEKYDDCSIVEAVPIKNSKVHCEGSGALIIVNQNTGQYIRKVMETMRFDIEDGKALVEGGHIWNDMFSVKDISIRYIRVS